jgi:hypothetical protein
VPDWFVAQSGACPAPRSFCKRASPTRPGTPSGPPVFYREKRGWVREDLLPGGSGRQPSCEATRRRRRPWQVRCAKRGQPRTPLEGRPPDRPSFIEIVSGRSPLGRVWAAASWGKGGLARQSALSSMLNNNDWVVGAHGPCGRGATWPSAGRPSHAGGVQGTWPRAAVAADCRARQQSCRRVADGVIAHLLMANTANMRVGPSLDNTDWDLGAHGPCGRWATWPSAGAALLPGRLAPGRARLCLARRRHTKTEAHGLAWRREVHAGIC